QFQQTSKDIADTQKEIDALLKALADCEKNCSTVTETTTAPSPTVSTAPTPAATPTGAARTGTLVDDPKKVAERDVARLRRGPAAIQLDGAKPGNASEAPGTMAVALGRALGRQVDAQNPAAVRQANTDFDATFGPKFQVDAQGRMQFSFAGAGTA